MCLSYSKVIFLTSHNPFINCLCLFFRNMFGFKSCPKKKMYTAGGLLENITRTVTDGDDDCSVPCKLTYLSLDYLPSLQNENLTRTFTFYFGSVNTLTRSKGIYDIWSFVAELGGWIGLFIGFSVPDLFDYICLFVGKVFSITK